LQWVPAGLQAQVSTAFSERSELAQRQIDCQWQAHDDGTSAQQKQQPKELLFVLTLAMVNVDDVRAETPSISTSSLVCSSKRRSAKKFLQWAVVGQKLVAT
jgi:hypothetical protein